MEKIALRSLRHEQLVVGVVVAILAIALTVGIVVAVLLLGTGSGNQVGL
jgi:hypothetical protein